MANFTILEEGNLGLIQQWQESEQQTEIKRKEYEAIKLEREEKIRILDTSVSEGKAKSEKITSEKTKLEMKGAKGNDNLMSDQMLAIVVSNIAEIRQLIDRKRAKGTNLPDPTTQLVEIETHINKILKFLHMAKEADQTVVANIMKKIKSAAQEEKRKKIVEKEEQDKLEQAAKLALRKEQRKIPEHVKKNIARSRKPGHKRREVKREVLSEDQKYIQTYLGISLEGEEKKKQ